MAAASPLERALADDIASYLRHVGRRAAGLTSWDRGTLLRTCLAYRLKDVSRSRASAVTRWVAEQFGVEVGGAVTPEGAVHAAAVSADWSAAARELIALVEGEGAAREGADDPAVLRATIAKLAERTAALQQVLHKHGLALDALLERAARDLTAHDAALEQAARESFDRVLGALSPESLKQHVARKTLSTEAMYKAALFDAAVEKFKQLELYHSKGRLVRDYKTAYKRYITEKNTN
jgi:hypothetical protein